ncbi:MAG: hypothetical protein K8J31_22035 [Anaerolineae bacterium]|nr:hypothetical protein [Anaerolineae bacterium]
MTKLAHYINDGNWLTLYSSDEQGHALSFLYNVMIWLERDHADRLVIENHQVAWFRNEIQVGSFPLTVPQPTPPFVMLLNEMISRDKVIGEHLNPSIDHHNVYSFRSSTD